jgi:hypothetical protein
MQAVEELNGKTVNEATLFCSRAMKRKERTTFLSRQHDDHRRELVSKSQFLNLYVKNLPDEVDDEKLRELFAPHGKITSAKVGASSLSWCSTCWETKHFSLCFLFVWSCFLFVFVCFLVFWFFFF